MTASVSTEMRVWVGCMGCYSAGALVGKWVDAIEADTVTVETLAESIRRGFDDPTRALEEHLGTWHPAASPHEELWCLDTEGLAPFIEGECSPAAAQRLAEQVGGLADYELEVLLAYVDALGRHNWDAGVDWSDVAREAADALVGRSTSIAAWAEELAEDTGTLKEMRTWQNPRTFREEVGREDFDAILAAVDWEQVGELWSDGYSVAERDGEVWLFSS
jgi:hypothetical protein